MRYCTQACFVNSQALRWYTASLIILLSWICKDTAILVLWKDLPWKPNLKAESSIIRLPLQPASIHVPHTHSPWRWWLYFAPTETPTFSFVSHQDNPCSKGSASSMQPREHCLADFKCFPYYPNWCAWLENTSGKMLWTDTSPNFTCVTSLKCHHVVFRVW